MKRGWLQLIWIFLLLVGQQAALTHSVWHLRDHLPARHGPEQARAQQPVPGKGQLPQSRLCDQHAALGALLAGDCPSAPVALTGGEAPRPADAAATWRVAQSTSTPPSRAPPALL